jgi:small conductance mechanosensitive channel
VPGILEEWFDATAERAPAVAAGVLVIVVGYLVGFVLRRVVARVSERADLRPGLAALLGRTVYVAAVLIAWFAGVGFILPGVDLAATLAALGVGGLVLGFALRDIAENYLAGLLIVFTRPFVVGDQIETGEHVGTVEDIQFRATTLRTFDNRRVVIPNSELYTNRVTVNTAYDVRRFSVEVTVPNDSDLDAVRADLLAAVTTVPDTLAEPAPEAFVSALHDYAYGIELRFWLSPPTRGEYVQSLSEVNRAVDGVLVGLGMDNIRPESVTYLVDRRGEGDPRRLQEAGP